MFTEKKTRFSFAKWDYAMYFEAILCKSKYMTIEFKSNCPVYNPTNATT